MASTASVKDLERWKAAGGTVQKPTKGKGSVQTFVSPGGEKLKSWQDAEKLLSKADETPQDTKSGKGAKRGKENAAADASTKKSKVDVKVEKSADKSAVKKVAEIVVDEVTETTKADEKASKGKAKTPSSPAKKKAKKSADDAVSKEEAAADSDAAMEDVKKVAEKAVDKVTETAKADEKVNNGKAKTLSSLAKKKAKKSAANAAPEEEAAADPVAAVEEVKEAAKADVKANNGKAKAPSSLATKKTKKSAADAAPDALPDAAAAPANKRAKKAAADAAPEAAAEDETPEAAADSDVAMEEVKEEVKEEDEAADGSVRRRAAQISYKEKSSYRESKSDRIVTSDDVKCESEAHALEQTGGKSTIKRRLQDFNVEDASGQLVPLDRIHLMKEDVFASGLIYSADGDLSKMKGQGRRTAKFGPIKEWKIQYSSAGAQMTLKTALGLYDLVKPSTSYRKVFTQLDEQVSISSQIYLALCPDVGGCMTASYDEVVAKLARSKVGKTYGSTRDALLLSGKFVLAQLAAMSEQQKYNTGNGKNTVSFEGSAFGVGLADEVSKNSFKSSIMSNQGGIKINDNAKGPAEPPSGPKDAIVEADEEMARRMQAQMDAEEAAGAGGRGRGGKAQVAPYIRISEEEIADDYPMPTQYLKEEEEVDELLMMEDEMTETDPEYLPKRLLHNFSIYNAEGFFSTLELVPMFSGVDHNIDIFASGVVAEDEGDWCTGGQALEEKPAGDAGSGSSAGGAAGAGVTAAAAAAAPQGGMRLFLSQIREWVVECSCDLLFISIRTDIAWYRLVSPDANYDPWFKTVLKAAQLSMKIIGMLSSESRASKLSFNDIVKRLTELQPEVDSTFISKKADRVERYVVVHGQIILNQFKHFPNKAVQKAAFVGELKSRMEARKHSKLYISKSKLKGVSLKNRTANPMKNRAAVGLKAKPMPATATTMVKDVWSRYFITPKGQEEDGAGDDAAGAEGAPLAKEVEEDVNEEDEQEDEAVEVAKVAAAPKAKAIEKKSSTSTKKAKSTQKTAWVGPAKKTDTAGRTLYSAVKVGSLQLKLGQVVELEEEASDDEDAANNVTGGGSPLGIILCMFEDKKGDKQAQVRVMVRGTDTMLGDAGSECELFVTEDTEVVPLVNVVRVCTATHLQRPWDWKLRVAHFKEDAEFRKKNAELGAQGKEMEYNYRHLYRPDQGMFCTIPDVLLDTKGEFQEDATVPTAFGLLSDGGKDGFIKNGKEYKIGDFMYLHPHTFEAICTTADDANVPSYVRKGGKHKGSNAGLRPFCIAQLVAVQPSKGTVNSARLKVRRFLRPEDISKDHAYKSDWADVYAQPSLSTTVGVDVDDVEGQCSVVLKSKNRDKNDMNAFVCKGTVDSLTTPSKFTQAPKSLGVSAAESASAAVPSAGDKAAAAAAAKTTKSGKRKSKKGEDSDGDEDEEMVEPEAKPSKAKAAAKTKGKSAATAAAASGSAEKVESDQEEEEEEPSAVALNSLDIFAGCGGLSEGMYQAGVANAKWAIEYEGPAADAFQLNNPDAKVFCNNCNVLLHAAMEKANLLDDCDASEDCMEASAKLTPETRAALPLPGEVDFMMGGPPCQGYSGMNRFNKGNWSLVQNSMVMAYLSYCDFYRPRYFLLENVRNFVSHNKSFTFRLTIRSLLEMGYQVRFGVLNAGLYGVPQSRKRTIIWAAAPGDTLPEYPAPIHVFQTPQLTINLPGGVQYTAVPNQVGAPRRAVTVKDAIADLPQISNGHEMDEMHYSQAPTSAYQKFIRGKAKVLKDHDCKAMNEVNLERCRCIPKNQPGADWRVLQEIVKADPSKEMYKGQPLVPWCLPNTADRHNGWRGLFGRLDLNGHFPTSTTDPQPMGKVGQVFHPTQDRIVSVRECARAQGFPDHFVFSGNVSNRHRQVGNAVPPPLAAALGRQLRKVLDAKRELEVQSTLSKAFGMF